MGNQGDRRKNNWTGFPAFQHNAMKFGEVQHNALGGRYRMDGGVADTACYKQAVNRQGELEAFPAREQRTNQKRKVN
jgi:hypothetical protein